MEVRNGRAKQKTKTTSEMIIKNQRTDRLLVERKHTKTKPMNKLREKHTRAQTEEQTMKYRRKKQMKEQTNNQSPE